MDYIIKINKKKIGKNKVNSVLASELYKKLEINEDFSKWIEDKLKSVNLIKDIDYVTLVKNPNEKHLIKEYILTLDSAKHIAMMSNSPKSFEIRSYFIEIEKKYQKKLLKNSKKCNKSLKNEIYNNINLFVRLYECKDKLKNCENEKNYIKESYSLKFQDIELEVLKVINQFKLVELKATHNNLSQSEAYEYIDSLLNSLKLNFQVFKFN